VGPASKIAVALALIVLASWMISSFWVSVQVRSPRQPFPAPTAHQSWVRSPEAGARAFFRLRLPVYGSLPQSATLWVEASQQVTGYVDQSDVAPPLQPPNRLVDTAPDLQTGVQTIDIRPALAVGLNVVGLDVVSYSGTPPRFRARVELREGDHVQTFGTTPSDWRSTTNALLTRQVLPQSGVFSRPKFGDGDWVPAEASSSGPSSSTVSSPPDAFTRPATGPALVGTFGSRSLVASRSVVFPDGCAEAWMRVAASGPYTVSLDGRPVATGGPGTNPATLPLSIYDLCPVERAGHHTLTVAVTSAQQPLIYLDGQANSGSERTSFATGPGWHVQRSTGPSGASAAVETTPESDLGVVFARSMGSISVPSGPLLANHMLLAGELLAIALLAVLLSYGIGTTPLFAAGGVLAGILPAVGVLLILTETNHLVNVPPPFPNTPTMLHLVLALFGLGLVASVAAAAATVRRPASRRAAASAPDPGSDVSRAAGSHWLRRHAYTVCVSVVALGWSLLQSYDVMFNPLWQDELSSLAAAQGIRAHIIPQWPSGFLYWKSELYSGLIAVVGGLTHDDPTVLKDISVICFGATILLFGLYLAPLVLPRHRVYALGATLAFSTAPFEMGHAQDIRMYQMEQCLVVVVSILLLKALQSSTTRRVALLMVAVVAMYLTHEESFGVLFIVPLALFAFQGLRWTRNWRWWAFGGAAAMVICLQLALAKLTHPPSFGVDPSGGPLITWSPQPFYYVANFFFTNPAFGTSITVVSSLALLGIAVGIARRDAVRLYLAAFWIVPTAVVSVALQSKDTRYAFLCLPFVFALGACGAVDIIDAVRAVVMRGIQHGREVWRRIAVELLALCTLVAVMLSLIGGVNDYGTWTGPAFGANISHRWLDYPTAVSFVKGHMEPGDAVIALATPNLIDYSLGRPPDYWIPPHRTATLLYVFEKGGQTVDTQFGIPTILNAEGLRDAAAAHRRTWLVGADSAIRALISPMRMVVAKQFVLMEEGEFVSVYLATRN
jgi:hypothetical protein